MKISEVKVFPTKEVGRLKAYATIVFDNSFIVRDLKVIEEIKVCLFLCRRVNEEMVLFVILYIH